MGEESHVFGFFAVSVILVQRILQLQRQTVIIFFDNVENLLFAGGRQVGGNQPLFDFRRKVLDDGPHVDQAVVEFQGGVLVFALCGGVAQAYWITLCQKRTP